MLYEVITSGSTEREIDPDLKSIQEKLIDIFGTKVNISGTLQKGKIEISYFSMEDLDRLYEIMKPE